MLNGETTLGERLRVARERRGWSQTQLAARSGVSNSLISRIERDEVKSPGHDKLMKLAAALGIEVAELTGEQPMARRSAVIQEGVARVPLMAVRVQASGEPAWLDSHEEVVTGASYVRGRPNAFAAVVTGRCMEPEIHAGDVVLVDPDREPQDREMVVVSVPGGGTLVKWYRVDELGRPYLRAADGTEIRPNGAKIEGVVFKVEKEARRDPEPVRRRAADQPGRYSV